MPHMVCINYDPIDQPVKSLVVAVVLGCLEIETRHVQFDGGKARRG
jgi:hypothetical protein